MTTFRVNYTSDPSKVVRTYVAATSSANPVIGLPINRQVTPTVAPNTASGDEYETINLSSSPSRSTAKTGREPSIIIGPPTITTGPRPPDGETLQVVPLVPPSAQSPLLNEIFEQKHSYRDIRDGYDLLGGQNAYTYIGNSRDRGTFANYPGASKRYNTNPTTNSTMARLAIPIPGNVKEFIHRSGFGHHMSRLAEAILTNGVTGLGYIDFLLQSIQEAFSEKVQISETIGDNYVAFFFGMAPPVFTFSGQLLNTFQDEWRTSMHMLYQNLLRGTKLARNKQLVSIYYDQMIANGYMLSHNQNFTAEMQMASSFSFQLLIKSITFFRLPRTRPTLPDKLPENIAFQNVYGLQRSAIKRTTRTVGVVKAEAAPSKGTLAPPAEPLSPTEAHKKLELYREAKPSQLTPSL